MRYLSLFFTSFLLMGCVNTSSTESSSKGIPTKLGQEVLRDKIPDRALEKSVEKFETLSADKNLSRATFAGGCFWCLEGPFESQEGVIEAFPGYAGGEIKNPSYNEVASGETGHREAVQVFFDPKKITYERLLEVFWRQIDPIDEGGQFADRGFHYTTAIFWQDGSQKAQAEASLKRLEDSGKFEKEIATKIIPFTSFYLAEEKHQNFYLKQSAYYKQYKKGSGRAGEIKRNDDTFDEIFSAEKRGAYEYTPAEIEALRKNLDPASYHVVSGGTERPFDNKYWDNKAAGIYVDKVTGEPLFSSTHKYDSGTGWPSFYQSIKPEVVKTEEDRSLGMTRTEVRSAGGDSHLGHVFEDGPVEQGGKRFCVNSASLRFVPLEDLEGEGYGEFRGLFQP